MYRISNQEIIEAQNQYKKKYKPFRKFHANRKALEDLGRQLCFLLETQNGMDTDDYCVLDNNKTERYLAHLPANSHVLILGTGTGRELIVANHMGFNVQGTTLGSRNIDYAVDELSIVPSIIHECLNESLPFNKETFDCVAGFQVFEHTIAPLLFLLEQGRVLKMGGQLILEWPPGNIYSMGANPHHQVCFTPGQAEALFMKAGFQEIELLYDDLTPITEDDKWRGDQKKMLVIKGVKRPTSEEYIRRVWNG
jgi:SAM-dependent methyltransferase